MFVIFVKFGNIHYDTKNVSLLYVTRSPHINFYGILLFGCISSVKLLTLFVDRSDRFLFVWLAEWVCLAPECVLTRERPPKTRLPPFRCKNSRSKNQITFVRRVNKSPGTIKILEKNSRSYQLDEIHCLLTFRQKDFGSVYNAWRWDLSNNSEANRYGDIYK